VIEIDGSPHFTADGLRHDAARDAWMASQGIRVVRFTGAEVENDTQRVLEQIRSVLRAIEADCRPSPPVSASADLQPLPQGKRGEKTK
jgi:very-short-patch-repair endonuclease